MHETKSKKRNTKKEIFLAAAELFSQKGYHGTSVHDIAKHIGIRTASIYNHYSSKESLMDDLLDYYLKRMESFYKRLSDKEFESSKPEDLGNALENLMLAYEPEETTIMFQLTRIVHFEQFNFIKAANAVIGTGYRDFVDAHIHFFDRLSDAGLIKGKANNRYYGEIYARLSLTFATQFLHPEIEPTIENQYELGAFVKELIISHQKNLSVKD